MKEGLRIQKSIIGRMKETELETVEIAVVACRFGGRRNSPAGQSESSESIAGEEANILRNN